MSILSTIGSGILRLGARVARSAAKKGATKTKDAVKKGVQNKRVANSRKVPKSQRTTKQQAARDKRAADLRAQRTAARAKRNAKVKSRTTGIKGRLAKTFGTGGLGGLLGSMLGGGKDVNDPTPKDGTGNPQPVPKEKATGGTDDKPIDLSWLPQAMAVAIPTIRDDEERRAYSLSDVIVTQDIELDEEGGIPFIESGTIIPSRIAEIGTLFAITDTLRNQVTDLNKQMFIANSTLKEIKKQLGLAIRENAATKRANERRRDEEAVEGGRIKKAAMFVGGAAAAYVTVKTMSLLQRMGNIAMLGSMALFADDVAAMFTSDDEEEPLPLVEDQDEALDYADEQLDAMEGDDTEGTGVDPTEEEISEESAEPQSELADTLEGAADAMSEGAAGTLLDAGMIAGGGAMVAGALGATATAAVLAPVAAAATALGAGMAVGTIIADNTEIDENISQAYQDFNEENLDEMTSREEMSQKYGEAQGTVGFFGDLLGEGLFDTEEDPKDIYAAFRDMTWDDHAELNKAYQEEYGQSLASATWKAVGDAGSEAINNLISQNTMDKHLAETQNEGDGVENKIYATSLESAQEGQYLTGEQMQELVSGEYAEAPVVEEIKHYTTEAAQIHKDLKEGKISGVEALQRMRENPIKLENVIPGGVSINDLSEGAASGIKETLQLPEVGEIIPLNEIIEEVPAALQEDVTALIGEHVEAPINKVVGELNSKVDTVVDETLDEKIKSVIVPMIQDGKPKKERGIPSGTTMTPTLETATPQFMAVDPFLTNRKQT